MKSVLIILIISLPANAVLNINNMFPVPEGLYTYIDFSKITDVKYRSLLQAEYRVIKTRQRLITKNARIVYKRKTDPEDDSPLTRRCNDFLHLEQLAGEYHVELK